MKPQAIWGLMTGLAVLFLPLDGRAAISNGMDAEIVIGQPDFNTNSSGVTQTKVQATLDVVSTGTKVLVNDSGSNRILIYNSIPRQNLPAADVVVGQQDFNSAATGTTSAQSNFNFARGMTVDGHGRFMIACRSDNRVLIYNSIPVTNYAPADLVVGQPDLTSRTQNNGGLSAKSLSTTRGVFSTGKQLAVTDDGNHRVLIWNSIPTQNFQPADVVLGQSGFTSNSANRGGSPGANTLSTPINLLIAGDKLAVADISNNRVLIWNSIPTVNGTPADVVVGQPDYASSSANQNQQIAGNTLNGPGGLASDGTRLFIADYSNNRVLVFNRIPQSNNASADFVLGQPHMNSGSENSGGLSARSMAGPAGLAMDGKRLFVGEETNRRVLIFDLSSQSADELGPQFTQGKSLIGKVFWDSNENGIQDEGENGIAGVKVASDTGIYAITDEDGKYHFPYIETGQRLLKVDPASISRDTSNTPQVSSSNSDAHLRGVGPQFTTGNPRKVTVTEGILTKISFGVTDTHLRGGSATSEVSELSTPSPEATLLEAKGPLLKVALSQDPLNLTKTLAISHIFKEDNTLEFTIECNYRMFLDSSELVLYDQNHAVIKSIDLPKPLPYKYILNFTQENLDSQTLSGYQLKVYDNQGNSDNSSLGQIDLA